MKTIAPSRLMRLEARYESQPAFALTVDAMLELLNTTSPGTLAAREALELATQLYWRQPPQPLTAR
jgi:F0F1-type ATP synthase gamma subunit